MYLYVFDDTGNQSYCAQLLREKDLSDLESVVPKIKRYIDVEISDRKRWAEEKAQKKKDINWTGRAFKRGDPVWFKGNKDYKACYSYVWTCFAHLSMAFYLIEHEDGYDRGKWLAGRGFRDGFESVHSSQLKEGLKYIEINCHNEFTGETDELVLVKEEEIKSKNYVAVKKTQGEGWVITEYYSPEYGKISIEQPYCYCTQDIKFAKRMTQWECDNIITKYKNHNFFKVAV